MFDVTTRFAILAVVETLIFEVTTFVVCKAFEAKMFPWTWRLAVGAAPVRILTPVLVILAYSVEPPKKAWRSKAAAAT